MRRPDMRAALTRSRDVLSKYGIDPVIDRSALMWAENCGHNLANAQKVADRLESAHIDISNMNLSPAHAAEEMRRALQKIGTEIFGS